jgi:hypothetical protein
MKPIERGEILGLAEYERIRPHFRARVIEEKKLRRTSIGPRATALFENRDTVLLQIQEMLRTERITREAAIAHEMETYNAFIPGAGELSCTVMIEIDDEREREAFLVAARGLEDAISIVVGGRAFVGKTTPDRVLPDRASAVIYLRIALDADAVAAIATGGVEIAMRVDHPAYRAETLVSREVAASIREDLAT